MIDVASKLTPRAPKLARSVHRVQIRKLKKPVESRYPSIQGVWDIDAPLHTCSVHMEHHG